MKRFEFIKRFALALSAPSLVMDALSGVRQRVFNVRLFGAKGDGVTDDSAAIQAAIAASDTNGGGTVYFPAGSYRFPRITNIDFDSSTITIE